MPIACARKILIVDDETDLVAPIALRLSKSASFSVAVASDGEEGLRRAITFQPDAALVDLAMPVMDGWELCRRLREDPRTAGIKIIIMTAWLSPDLRARAAAERVYSILFKPFEESDLLEALAGGEAGPAGGSP